MDDFYPSTPDNIPANLTRPSSAYRRHAWIAMAGLMLFVLLYFTLSSWFAWSSYRYISLALLGGHNVLLYWLIGLSCGFLAVFMFKALLFVKHGTESDDIEVTSEQEPKLFAFLNRLADEAGAPRPHRVFLSARVNACVFYDLSLLNLIFPSKKNLEIGLALVNVLTLSELKAVLAHEFGHFGQKSMAVGRWVYVAQQIAAHIIARRDALDSFLGFISRIDLRVAWIGWILRLIVWSLRAMLETAFNLVIIAQRALSREMEFQADLVAVAMTGSDALIHALHKLQAADEAWDRALQFVNSELNQGNATQDMFTIQQRIIERISLILNDSEYGKVPMLPEQNPEKHRLFNQEIAQPPRMWATHPHNHERENNAKKNYVNAPLDERSAWQIFSDADALKASVSKHLLREIEATPINMDESLKSLDKQYQHQYLKSFYRGVYLGRSVVLHAERAEQLYSSSMNNAIGSLDSLYPESLKDDLEHLRNLQREKALLQALYDGVYKAADGVIRFRGNELKRRELPEAITTVNDECQQVQDKICAHDQLCRSAHLAAAASLQNGWDLYLKGTLAVLHYADHCEAHLRDSQGFLSNVVAVVLADGRVSSGELKRVIKAATSVYASLQTVYTQSHQLHLDETLRESLKIDNWQDGLGKFDFPPPSKANINEWMQHVDGWINNAVNALSALSHAALEQLLNTEARVAVCIRNKTCLQQAPGPSIIPGEYPTLVPGSERERQKRLGWWDRFQVADGFFPALLRFAVSASIVGAALFVSAAIDLWR